MMSANPFSFKLSATALALAIIAAFGLDLPAQDVPAVHVGTTTITGVPDDWSHHHIVFADPGTEQDAIKSGVHEQWLKTVNNPRYVIQQMKHGLPVQGPASQDVEMWRRIGEQQGGNFGRFGGGPRPGMPGGPRGFNPPFNPAASPLQRDWSMNSGGGLASLTLGIPAASASITGTTTLTLDAPGAAAITASAPVAATQTGTFTGNPTGGQTVTVAGTALTASLSTAATGSVSIASTFCFAPGDSVDVDGTTFTTNATAGTGTFVVNSAPAAGDTVVIGGVTYTFETTLAGASPANQVLVNTFSTNNTSRNLSVAINNGGTCGNTVGGVCTRNVAAANTVVSSTNTNTTSTQTMTSICAGNAAISGTGDGAHVTVNSVVAGGAGTTSAAGATFAIGTNAATATNIYNDINGNATTSALVTATNPSGGTVDLSIIKWGSAGNGSTLSTTANSGVTITAFAGGTNGTNTGTSFAIDNVNADNATDLAAAITRSVATVTAASGGTATVTVTDKTAGTGGNSLTLAEAASNFAWTGGATTLAGGSDGTSNGTNFSYWTTSAYDTAAQLATSLAASINASSVNGTVTATPSGANLVIDAKDGGSGGNSYTAAVANFTGVTGTGTFSGGISGAGLAGQYPAKYSFSTGTISASNCTSDYVVFPTGGAGGATQATIVGYNNIYKTTCSGTVPSIAWAYNTGGTATLSPVISYDGTQIAYIQVSGGHASLVMLKPGSGGAVTAPTAPALAATAALYHTCTAPCYFAISLNGTPNDTNSAPYYDYDNDIMYVGDSSGKLHKFTGVFFGSPAEAGASWPITVSANVLTSPVYDSGTSGNIFVADSGGFLYSYHASTGAFVLKSGQLATATAGVVDAPVVDSSLQTVYVFVGNDENTSGGLGCDVTTGCVGTYQFAAGAAGTGSGLCRATSATAWASTLCGVEAVSGTATAATPAYYDGAFDNIYLSSANGTGYLWGCAPHVGSTPRLESTTITANTIVPAGDVYSAGNVVNGPILSSATSACSPVTEIYGSNGATSDYIFMSVPASGQETGCTGACLYSFVVGTGGAHAAPATLHATAGSQEAGGTGGIIVDNLSPTSGGGSEVYFTTIGTQACNGNGTTGTGTGACAVQATQTGLN